jgi:succinyl-CoA synthetase alpha subunit
MPILVDRKTLVLVQGLTGREGRFHALRNRSYGTQVVAGITPGKGGSDVDGIPVFDTVGEATVATRANASVIFVPARAAADAILESADSGVGLVVCITEGIPANDTARVRAQIRRTGGVTLIGPNCPGLISPGQSNAGIIPADITQAGRIGLVSKSGTLTYQMMYELRDIGFSSAVGIGGDPVIGTTHIDCLQAFADDSDTDAIVMIGEIGGDAEERAAEYIAANVDKPVVGYVAGFTAPEGKTMGHAGAIVSGSSGTAAAKQQALEAAGVRVGKTPSETAQLVRQIMTELALTP